MRAKQGAGQGRSRIDKAREGDNQLPDITRYKAEPQEQPQEPSYLVEKV